MPNLPLIDNRFKLKHKIGEGSFGDVYSGTDVQTRRKVAIKIAKEGKEASLEKEAQIYKHLQNKCTGELDFYGIPNFYWFGRENGYYYLVIDRQGSSYHKLFEAGQLSLDDVGQLAIEGLYILETLHSHGLIHQDMKPDNFLQRRSDNKHKRAVLIDYGLTKHYLDEHNQHLPMTHYHRMVGTARYVSCNTHLGLSQSRRDDLESFGYMLVYLAKGKLPWNGLREQNKAKRYEKIGQIKIETPLKKICHGLPPVYEKYLSYCRNLAYSESPDYHYLRNLFIKQKSN